jgi:AraC family transcriptional regulator of adaptative response / DNA-3-methyladenine glycosylase II
VNTNDAPGPERARATARLHVGVDLPVRQPFDAPGVFGFLAVRAVAGVEATDLSDARQLRYARTLTLAGGPGAIEVTAARENETDWRVRARLELTCDADAASAVALIGRMLDLDADPAVIDAALAGDPALAPLVARTPGMRVPGAVDPHELVVRALVGQQISVAAARTHLGRLSAMLGSPYSSGFPGLDRLFPTSAQIASLPEPAGGEALDPDRPLRLPGQSIRTIRATAEALADGELHVHAGADPAALRGQLLARPGIGPWTAAYIAMRVLHDPDAWLVGDVALLSGAQAIGVLGNGLPKAQAHRALARRAAAWAPWRSYAAMHLWQAATASGPRAPARAAG